MHFNVLKSAQDTADKHNLKTIKLRFFKKSTFLIMNKIFEWSFGPWMGDTPTEVKLYVTQSHKFWDFGQLAQNT